MGNKFEVMKSRFIADKGWVTSQVYGGSYYEDAIKVFKEQRELLKTDKLKPGTRLSLIENT